MSEPQWKTELRDGIRRACAKADGFGFEHLEPWDYQTHVEALLPHAEEAFKRGHEAGSSKAGYRLVQENERLRHELALAHQTNQRKGVCPTCLSAIGASESTASADEPPEGSAS